MGGGQSVASNGGEVREILNKMESERIQREIAYREALAERKRAYELAKNREMFRWISSGGFVTILTALYSAHYHKNVLHILPVYPIFFYIAYEAHLCYGNKLEIIRKNAVKIFEKGGSAQIFPITTAKEVQNLVAEIFEQD